jgi:LPS-assembly protein
MILICSLQGSLTANAQNNQGKPPSAFGPKKPLIATPPPIDRSKPMLLHADELVYDNARNVVTARGNVEIYYNNYTILADQVVYDQANNALEARGNVRIKEPDGAVINADRFQLTDDFRDGFIDSLRIVTKEDARIAAAKATRVDGDTVIYDRGYFTPCKPCEKDPSKAPLWQVKAVKITHNQKEGTIYYENAQLEFFGVPVGYVPFFWSPDPSVKRKSGFLAPEVRTSGDLGFSYEQPYYFALDPSYDFTFNPAIMTRQGVLWQGEWRQRLSNGQYSIKGAAIDQDASKLPDTVANRQSLDGFRGSLETKGRFSLSSWWSFGWDVTVESDDTFRRFYKLDSVLRTDRVSNVYLEGMSERSYFGMYGYHFGGIVANDTTNTTSVVHPIIDYNYVAKNPMLGGELSFDANALSMSRDRGSDTNRLVAQVKWRRQMIDNWGQVFTPFARVRGDVYQLSNTAETNPGIEEKSTVTRGMAAAGVTYQYPFVARGPSGSHIIEPTAQVIARPAVVEQAGIPNEDAKSLLFNDTLLFQVDKFSGYDRIETGVRSNLGVQYTYQADSGGYLRLLAGQSIHLGGKNPYSIGTGLEERRSDYVLGAYLEPTPAFRFLAQSRFDADTLELQRTDLFAYGAYGPLQATVNYAYTKENPFPELYFGRQEILGAAQLKIADHWYLTGSTRYDIEAGRLLQDSIGIKYLDDCFMLTTVYTETRYEDRDVRPDRSVMVRFELKHLGGFGYRGNAAQTPFAENIGERQQLLAQ